MACYGVTFTFTLLRFSPASYYTSNVHAGIIKMLVKATVARDSVSPIPETKEIKCII
jgi:hypothetical protein